jgi:recombination protein RecA
MSTELAEKPVIDPKADKPAAEKVATDKPTTDKPARHGAAEAAERTKAIDLAVAQIEKQFGAGSIMKLGEAHRIDVETIPTGSLSLDLALGGGLPQGRIIEIYGPESSGKTTLALHAVAEVQRNGGVAAFVDAEHALDPEYAQRIGINLDTLLISQPDTGEQALEITETLVRSSAVDIIVIDSVAALVPRAEIEGDMGDAHVGLQARLMSQALRKLTGVISKSKTTVVFLNQLRIKIGVMFGNPETTAGGQALKYYASVRMDIRGTEQIKDGDVSIGKHVKVKIVKNKVAAPFKVAEFDIMFNEGISTSGDLIDLAVKYGLVIKSGAWYSYKDEKIGQGREAAKQYLKDHKDLMTSLSKDIRKIAQSA